MITVAKSFVQSDTTLLYPLPCSSCAQVVFALFSYRSTVSEVLPWHQSASIHINPARMSDEFNPVLTASGSFVEAFGQTACLPISMVLAAAHFEADAAERVLDISFISESIFARRPQRSHLLPSILICFGEVWTMLSSMMHTVLTEIFTRDLDVLAQQRSKRL